MQSAHRETGISLGSHVSKTRALIGCQVSRSFHAQRSATRTLCSVGLRCLLLEVFFFGNEYHLKGSLLKYLIHRQGKH